MTTESDVEVWLCRLRDGDGEAARILHDRFSRRLLAVVRRRLDPGVLRKMDPEDILQATYEAFFARYRRGGARFESWQGIWGVMRTIATRKCRYWSEHFRAGRRDLRIEVPISDRTESACGPWEPSSREWAPEESAIAAEVIERLARRLKPRDRRVVALHLEGHPPASIARMVRRSERTVERVLRAVYVFVRDAAA